MMQTDSERHISKGTPFLGSKFLIVCIVFNLLILGSALVVFLVLLGYLQLYRQCLP